MFERCLYFNTNALARKLNSLWEQAFSSFDLPPSHAYLLRLVLERPGLSQQVIAEELRLNKSTVTRFIVALEKKALLVRRESDSDQRERVVYPSETALALHQPLEQQGANLYAAMCEALGEEQVNTFVQTARVLNEKLQEN